eukprot:6318573-Pyramimonas_sp.AAC.1
MEFRGGRRSLPRSTFGAWRPPLTPPHRCPMRGALVQDPPARTPIPPPPVIERGPRSRRLRSHPGSDFAAFPLLTLPLSLDPARV